MERIKGWRETVAPMLLRWWKSSGDDSSEGFGRDGVRWEKESADRFLLYIVLVVGVARELGWLVLEFG